MTADSPQTPDAEVAPLERLVRLGRLMDLYGGLLTERQREFMRLHYEDDLSFGEIARQHNVSRQAIHDAVKHAEASLEDIEAKLGFLGRGMLRPAFGDSAEAAAGAEENASRMSEPAGGLSINPAGLREAVAKLEAIQDRLRRSGGIIYNADGLARELQEIAQHLDRMASEP